MSIEFKWVPQEQKYARGENLMVGKWCVGSISPDVVNSEFGNVCVYANLPGLKTRLRNRPNDLQAKAALEHAVSYWFQECGLAANQGVANEQNNR
ncbi:hypothetical protein [Pantoea sp. X85]|uniref:hypothetical protein n=1 Tax=Pantoea sp. X85 TaxID=3037258 RepID=UPI002412EAFD|nr:hypothetical protein [Pantoea sp. X85]WFL66398.1 hypothetical protein P6287_13580 [Pantoea sp. X85]